ncbi:uncharacterized protein LOC128954755 [Oppia nitens]|uniref:uncharacterized protein LOC128954755 n=1 Tax=Oppia nitens TaxID=1686743 RepID=UPI0023DCB0E5|nr:uncharacterized protein LOC128954755 [Oppia nitens]
MGIIGIVVSSGPKIMDHSINVSVLLLVLLLSMSTLGSGVLSLSTAGDNYPDSDQMCSEIADTFVSCLLYRWHLPDPMPIDMFKNETVIKHLCCYTLETHCVCDSVMVDCPEYRDDFELHKNKSLTGLIKCDVLGLTNQHMCAALQPKPLTDYSLCQRYIPCLPSVSAATRVHQLIVIMAYSLSVIILIIK